MNIFVNLINQKLKIATNLKTIVDGTQNFIRFSFNLSDEWNGLQTFAQFSQNGKAYNQYLDSENSVYLPSEICAGICTLMLYGSGGQTIATTNYLTLKIDENILISDASSTEISETLYTQLVSKFNDLITSNSEIQKAISAEVARAMSAEQENTNAIKSNADDIATKASQTEVDEIKSYLGYSDDDIVGLCVDYQNNRFTRLGGAKGKEAGVDFDTYAMYGGRRRCNVANDGTINAYYGEESYTDDGSNGQVMVYQPAFYYRVVPIVLEKNADTNMGYHLRKASYYISDKPHRGFKLHPAFYNANGNPVEYILYSAYEGSLYDSNTSTYVNDAVDTEKRSITDNDLLCSVADVKPISGVYKVTNKSSFEQMAQARGEHWHLETIKTLSANQLLMMIELGTMNTQQAIGMGIVNTGKGTESQLNDACITGSTKTLGNSTGVATESVYDYGSETRDGRVAISYRGIENVWGNLWKHIAGVCIFGENNGGGQPYIVDDYGFSDTQLTEKCKPVGFSMPDKSGYISAMGYSSDEYDWLLMPSESSGTSALPVGDQIYAPSSNNKKSFRGVMMGGNWYSSAPAGGFYTHIGNPYSYRARITGGRLVYIP